MPDDVIHPRKLPRQARAAATVEVILEAAARVLSDKSLAGFNTNQVANVAGVSVGSVYQYFPNKAALVAALVERAQGALADAVERSVQQSRGQPLADVLAELTEIAIDHQFANARLAAALDHEEQRLPLDSVLSAAARRMVAAVQAAFEEHPELIAVGVPPDAAADGFAIAKALVEAEASRSTPDVAGLRARVLRALLGYLLPPTLLAR